MSEKNQNDERRDEAKKESQTPTDSTLERLVEALTKIDATLNRLNERLETLERRVDDGQTAKKNKAWRNLRELDEDDFDAPSDWSDYPDAYKKGFADVDDGENCDDSADWEDVYDCAADVDEFSNVAENDDRVADHWNDWDDEPYREWAKRFGRSRVGTGNSKARRFDDYGPKIGERDDEWVSPNELKAAETAEKKTLEPGTYRVGTDLEPGRYLAKPLAGSAVVRVECSQWRGVYTLKRDEETPEKKKTRKFDIAVKLIDDATLRTVEPIEVIYLGPIEPSTNQMLNDL